ncbi:unnamed protein product [Mycena citricolor]|uniref:BTB domain-containing protein n=1 Tax=Mycena citricolor TaxID=2018698 RepID=A0AAD2HGT3_9AGAR|nr:unnamed protein product [Mycena citricolor]
MPPRPSLAMPSPPVSYTYNASPASCEAVDSTPRSPTPTTSTHHSRRPSITNPMHWLSRSSTQLSLKHTARISEPKPISADLFSSRAGTLGSGATVVKTPEEALRDTRVRLTHDGYCSEAGKKGQDQSPRTSSSSSEDEDEDEIPSPLDSPPLPAVPVDRKSSSSTLDEFPSPPAFTFPPRPTRAVPLTPALSLRSSLKWSGTKSAESLPSASVKMNSAEHVPTLTVPSLPANISPTPSPPPFNAILVSESPISTHCPMIVSLETSTTTLKTTMETLCSRPSFLSQYMGQFGRRRVDSSASSVYSTASADQDVYRRHLASQGLLPHSSCSVHIFLDRPSEPYAHILAYLRSPCGTAECPEMLPTRASSAGLDSLLELRDEAAYLGLDGLHKLCVDEIGHIRSRGLARHRGPKPASMHSLSASISSLHTMLERVERHHSDDAGSRSLPTPDSALSTKLPRHASLRTPPAGWI